LKGFEVGIDREGGGGCRALEGKKM